MRLTEDMRVRVNLKITAWRKKQHSPTGVQHALLSQDSKLTHSVQMSHKLSAHMGGLTLSRPKAVVVRFVRAESICGSRTSKDSHWLAKAIHSKAAWK